MVPLSGVLLLISFTHVSCLAMKMEETSYFEMLLRSKLTARRRIPGDKTAHDHRTRTALDIVTPTARSQGLSDSICYDRGSSLDFVLHSLLLDGLRSNITSRHALRGFVVT